MWGIATRSWCLPVRRAALALILATAGPWADADEREDGAREFRTYCAVCHGLAGRGDGPMANQLIRAPKDITLLGKKNGGSFPETVVYQIIDGRRLVIFHGPQEMPIWGDRFRAGSDEATVDARISALVSYVESIQVP